MPQNGAEAYDMPQLNYEELDEILNAAAKSCEGTTGEESIQTQVVTAPSSSPPPPPPPPPPPLIVAAKAAGATIQITPSTSSAASGSTGPAVPGSTGAAVPPTPAPPVFTAEQIRDMPILVTETFSLPPSLTDPPLQNQKETDKTEERKIDDCDDPVDAADDDDEPVDAADDDELLFEEEEKRNQKEIEKEKFLVEKEADKIDTKKKDNTEHPKKSIRVLMPCDGGHRGFPPPTEAVIALINNFRENMVTIRKEIFEASKHLKNQGKGLLSAEMFDVDLYRDVNESLFSVKKNQSLNSLQKKSKKNMKKKKEKTMEK